MGENSVYSYRNPNDKTSYIDGEALMHNVNMRRKWYRQWANQQDAENLLFNSMTIAPQDKENMVVFIDGSIRDISKYKKPQYLSYNGNNPALWQGGQMVMSTSALYRQKIDEEYNKTRDLNYIKTKRREPI